MDAVEDRLRSVEQCWMQTATRNGKRAIREREQLQEKQKSLLNGQVCDGIALWLDHFAYGIHGFLRITNDQ